VVGDQPVSEPTPEQRAASDPHSSVWVTASAGTGKTRVLTDRLLRLLLDGADPQGILCITFTRAAAAEMTARIEARLAAWATKPDAEVLAELRELLGPAWQPDFATLDRARRLFARVLELPQGLQIQTIHAFCAAVLRRFPLEAGIPPHFETLDDASRRELFAEAREAVLREAAEGRDPVLAEALRRLVGLRGDRQLYDALDAVLAERTRLQDALEHHGGIDGLIAALARELGVDPDADPAALVRTACTDGAFDRVALERLVAIWRQGTATARRAAEALAGWLAASARERAARWPELAGTVFNKQWEPHGHIFTPKFRREHPELSEIYQREADRWRELVDRLKALETLAETAAWVRVGAAILARYEELKAREGLLDFDDLILHTVRLFESGVDWVLYKLDARIEHILVDEAQDTSPEQWRVIEGLLDEIFAGEGQHEGRLRTLFVVGDEKQSIYSFQGADLAGFRRVRARIRERARAAGHPFHETTLTRSFRSVPAVLRAVDALFAAVPEARAGVLGEGEMLRHEPHRQDEPGAVELWPLLRAGGGSGADDDEPWPLPRPRPAEDPEPRLADLVARTIARWLAEGEMLESKGRPLRPGDIMILVRRRGVIQELVVRALRRRGVPVAGVDRMRLDEHIAVRDLLAIGHAVLLPEDDYTLACALVGPLFGLSFDDLEALAAGREGVPLIARLDAFARKQGGRFAEALERFERWRARADYVPPYEWYAWILGAEGGRRRLLERLGVDAAEPIEAFLARALQFEEGHASSLQGFLHWFELGAGELSRDPEKGGSAVRVVTVHGAKGLEAPVVFLLDAGPHGAPRETSPLVWSRRPDGSPHLPFARRAKDDLPQRVAELLEAEARARAEEENRLLYVALTRAQDRLIVTGWAGPRAKEDELDRCWHGFLRRTLEGLQTEITRHEMALAPGSGGEVLVLKSGARRPPPRADGGEREPGEREAAQLPPWALRPAPVEKGLESPCAPTRLSGLSGEEDEEPPPFTEPRERDGWRRGLAIHALFQHLPAVPPDRRLEVARRMLAAEFPDVAEPAEVLLAEVLRVMELPALAPAFGPDARAEQPIAGHLPDGTPVLGRIDRFVVEDGRILLVDFKTNRRPPSRGAMPQRVLRQMQAYAQVLSGIFPGRRVEAAVVWTAGPEVTFLGPGQLLSDNGGQG